jgi:dynein heavy chain, axonemal
MLPEPSENVPQEVDQLERLYVFCVVWSIGGALMADERDKFSDFIKTSCGLMLGSSSLYDNYYDMDSKSYVLWDRKVPEYTPPANRKFNQILVPTSDTVRYSWLLNQIMVLKKPCMFVGDSGTAKTVTIYSQFKSMSMDKYLVLTINFSSRTTSLDFQKNFEENIDKRTFKQYGPKSAGKQLILFIDDLNMPKIDKYGT